MNEEQWNPPAVLPAPTRAAVSSLSIFGIALAIGVSVAAGFALFLSAQAFYVWILYNSLIGAALGWALSFSVRKGMRNKVALVGLAAVLSVVPYVVMRYGFYLQLGADASMSFPAFFVLAIQARTVFGFEPGLVGNSVILLAEIAITFYYAYQRIEGALRSAKIAGLPEEVLVFVVNGLASGWDSARLRNELGGRGWLGDDAERAIGSGLDIIESMQQEQ